jgi:hypothetical protein
MPTSTGQPPSLMDDGNFLLELDKIGTNPGPSQPAPRRPFWAPDPRVAAADGPGDGNGRGGRKRVEPREPHEDDDEVPPAAFLRSETVPVHTRLDAFDEADADPNADKELVPSSLAALVILLCMCVGASGAALVFRDRVQHIVATWRMAAR